MDPEKEIQSQPEPVIEAPEAEPVEAQTEQGPDPSQGGCIKAY